MPKRKIGGSVRKAAKAQKTRQDKSQLGERVSSVARDRRTIRKLYY